MTKEEFIKTGLDVQLGVQNKKYSFPQFSLIDLGKETCHVRVSLKGEINNNILYYVVGGNIYELDLDFLRQQMLDESDYYNTGFFKYSSGKLNAICVPFKYLQKVSLQDKTPKETTERITASTCPVFNIKPVNRLLSKDDFYLYVDELLKEIKQKLISKGKEYNRDSSWDNAVRQVAYRKQKHVLEVVDGYLDKHIQSYYDLITQLKVYPIPDDIEEIKQLESLVDEKLGDIINWMIIQKALMLKQIRGKL